MTINLNDRVRFKVRAPFMPLFRGNPEIRLAAAGPDGTCEGEAQLHSLIGVIGPHIRPWLSPPIDLTLEVIGD